jgi:hypothetical protein
MLNQDLWASPATLERTSGGLGIFVAANTASLCCALVDRFFINVLWSNPELRLKVQEHTRSVGRIDNRSARFIESNGVAVERFS